MKRIKGGKKGQTMSLPFTMIFSIILVAIVLFVGFFVIKMFLDRGKQVEFGLLPTEIQEKVSNMKFSGVSEANESVSGECPDVVEYVCFVDFSMPARGSHSSKFDELKTFPYRKDANFFYYPLWIAEDYSSFSDWAILCRNIECLKVPQTMNPLCVKVINGKVSFTLVKEAGQPYIMVKP